MLLTTFMMPLTLFSPQAIGLRNIRVREFIVAMLVMETGMIGAFLAVDLFVFYVFWELMLIPMYFIIGIWGGERRLYASIKFVIYTLVGSLLMLAAILYLYVQAHALTGTWTFDYAHLRLADAARAAAAALLRGLRPGLHDQGAAVPAAHLVARRPRRGAHRRLGDPGGRDAEVRHLRLPALRDAVLPAGHLGDRRRCIAILSVIGIIFGALMAYVQDDVKKLVAYSSVSHLGFVVLGLLTLNPQGIQGGIFQMLAHGISTGGLFLGGRRALRPAPHPAAGRLRRAVEADAGVRRLLPGHRAGLGRPARAVRASSASSWC